MSISKLLRFRKICQLHVAGQVLVGTSTGDSTFRMFQKLVARSGEVTGG